MIREAHFLAFTGEPVMIKLIRPLNGKREYKGVLEGYDNGDITIRLDDGSGFCVNKKETAYVRLDDFND